MDFKQAAVVYHRANGEAVRFTLPDHTQRSLFEALLQELRRDELAGFFAGTTAPSPVESLMAKLHADSSRTEFLELEEVTHTDRLFVHTQTASAYADALYAVFTATARFRARLEGHMTPIVVWPEHFDLSTLWFVEGDMNDKKAHMNFGFAPYSPGLERPYLYAYAYPYPERYDIPRLPDGARWHTEGWTGVVVPYNEFARRADPEQFVENILEAIFAALRPLLGLD